jgi:hypothetical protein
MRGGDEIVVRIDAEEETPPRPRRCRSRSRCPRGARSRRHRRGDGETEFACGRIGRIHELRAEYRLSRGVETKEYAVVDLGDGGERATASAPYEYSAPDGPNSRPHEIARVVELRDREPGSEARRRGAHRETRGPLDCGHSDRQSSEPARATDPPPSCPTVRRDAWRPLRLRWRTAVRSGSYVSGTPSLCVPWALLVSAWRGPEGTLMELEAAASCGKS